MTIEGAARANLVLSIGNLLISSVASIAVARLLSPAAYADYATILALLTWSLLFSEGGGSVGFSRFLKEAADRNARLSLYWMFIRVRLMTGVAVVAALTIGGPWWVSLAGLSASEWSTITFGSIGGLVTVVLLGQIGYYALINSFRHSSVLKVTQLSSIGKAVALVAVAWWWSTPFALTVALMAVALMTTLLYHLQATSLLQGEKGGLPVSLKAASLRHGLVSIFDKSVSAIGGGPFLLIILAGIYQRSELAMLALATDFLQRVLSVANLPVGNMVMPYVHRHEGSDYFESAVKHVCTLTLLIFLPVLGGAVVFLPHGVTLMFGEPYEQATWIALAAVVPMFAEAWARMTFGFALIARRRYSIIFRVNAAQAIASLVMLAVTFRAGLVSIVIGQGLVQIATFVTLVILAARHGLIDVAILPRGLVLCILAATSAGLVIQYVTVVLGLHAAVGLSIGVVFFVLAILAGFRFIVIVEPQVASIIQRLVGAKNSQRAALLFPGLFVPKTDHA